MVVNHSHESQEDHYYSFGMRMPGMSYVGNGVPQNKYLYNGKELQDETSGGNKLNWSRQLRDFLSLRFCFARAPKTKAPGEYDYGFRNYDPVIGRWHSIDPLAENNYSILPYVYVENNPMLYKDPDGRWSEVYYNGYWMPVATGSMLPNLDGGFGFGTHSSGGSSSYGMGTFHSGALQALGYNTPGIFDAMGSDYGGFYTENTNAIAGILASYGFWDPSETDEIWKDFPRGSIVFTDNYEESARHIMYAIKHSVKNGGYGIVNIDLIFDNFHSNMSPGVLQGVKIRFDMKLDGEMLHLQLDFAVLTDVNGNYDPYIDFSFTTHNMSPQLSDGGLYWNRIQCRGGTRDPWISVAEKGNGKDWRNWDRLRNWLYKK